MSITMMMLYRIHLHKLLYILILNIDIILDIMDCLQISTTIGLIWLSNTDYYHGHQIVSCTIYRVPMGKTKIYEILVSSDLAINL